MKLQDFRVGFRILVKDPVYSLVAILGLALGLAVCLLLLGFARYSWQYNAHVPDADNVYIVKHRNNLHLGGAVVRPGPAASARGGQGSTGRDGGQRLC